MPVHGQGGEANTGSIEIVEQIGERRRMILKVLGKKGKKPDDMSWSEWQDLNLRPLRPERSALPG
jgi:hypothetical protein